MRFSTVAGNKGSSDLARDVRGFAVKLYTQEGNWDLVGNNIPVFFIQDADQVPRPHPRGQAGARPRLPAGAVGARQLLGLRLADAGVDPHAACGRCPTGPSRGRSGSWRASASTRSGFVNAEGASTFVKFHWKPKLGLQSVVWNEAVKINGADPDFHRRDLWDAIQSGDFPEWELGVQLFDDEFADRVRLRRARRHQDHPRGGSCRSARRPARARPRASTTSSPRPSRSRSARRTSSPGIDFTNDPLLQGRNFSYLDTQLKRLGSPNFTHLPVNAPKCPFAQLPAGRAHGDDATRSGGSNYEPNSWPAPSAGRAKTRRRVHVVRRSRRAARSAGCAPESFADHYSQARQFYVSQTPVEQQHIADAFVFELSKVETADIRERMVANLRNVDEDLARARSPTGSASTSCPSRAEPRVGRSPTCRRHRR